MTLSVASAGESLGGPTPALDEASAAPGYTLYERDSRCDRSFRFRSSVVFSLPIQQDWDPLAETEMIHVRDKGNGWTQHLKVTDQGGLIERGIAGSGASDVGHGRVCVDGSCAFLLRVRANAFPSGNRETDYRIRFVDDESVTIQSYEIADVSVPHPRRARAQHYRPLQAQIDRQHNEIEFRVGPDIVSQAPIDVLVHIRDADGTKDKHFNDLPAGQGSSRSVGFRPPLAYASVTADDTDIWTRRIIELYSDEAPFYQCR